VTERRAVIRRGRRVRVRGGRARDREGPNLTGGDRRVPVCVRRFAQAEVRGRIRSRRCKMSRGEKRRRVKSARSGVEGTPCNREDGLHLPLPANTGVIDARVLD